MSDFKDGPVWPAPVKKPKPEPKSQAKPIVGRTLLVNGERLGRVIHVRRRTVEGENCAVCIHRIASPDCDFCANTEGFLVTHHDPHPECHSGAERHCSCDICKVPVTT